PAIASSGNGGNTAAKAFDGNTGTRWESLQGVDPQWIRVDLGQLSTLNHIRLNWEPAYATSYTLDVSNDDTSWTTLVDQTNSDGGLDDYNISAVARYVRMYGRVRALPYGYSLWEFEVYGLAGTPTPTPTASPRPTA